VFDLALGTKLEIRPALEVLLLPPINPPQDVAGAIIAARDASELIAVTHPAAARQMQRVAAQMVVALRAIAADEGGGGTMAGQATAHPA
jgi:hypothetical protein